MSALGIDVGTTNVKVVIVDDDARIRASASRTIPTARTGDSSSQDPALLWNAVRAAVVEATNAEPDAAATVGCIGVCSQYSSIVPVDLRGDAVAPIKLYWDTRGADRCWEILSRHDEAFDTWVERHGIPPVGGGLSLGHLLHFQLDRPEVHRRTAAYLEVMDLVNLRLTGRVAANQCTMFAAQLCDNRTVGVNAYDADLVEMSGVDATRLPPLIDIDGVHGELLDEVADDMGLPRGIPVMAAMNDTQAGAIATGALGSPARCGLMVGTTAVLIQSMDAAGADLEHEVVAMPAPVPGRFVVMAENGIAGRAVEHALSLLTPGDRPADEDFAELDEALASTSPGAGGLLFLPWLTGSMSPSSSSDMRGGFLGMTLDTERADLLRSTVEGVARNLAWLLPAVEGLSGTNIDRLVVAGGGARSLGVAQVIADVCARPVSVLSAPSLVAACAVGTVAMARLSGEPAEQLQLRVERELEPDRAAVERHEHLQPIFEAAYSANAPICQALGS